MTLISGKLMYVGVISVIIIAVASYGLFFFFQRVNEKEYQRKHIRTGTGEADKFNHQRWNNIHSAVLWFSE